jgi:hypothetical protein
MAVRVTRTPSGPPPRQRLGTADRTVSDALVRLRGPLPYLGRTAPRRSLTEWYRFVAEARTAFVIATIRLWSLTSSRITCVSVEAKGR